MPFFILRTSKKIKFLALSAMIAALYVVLTYVSFALGLDKGAIQLRLSETLAALPAFTPAGIPGLFIGCMLSSFLTGGHPLDAVFGSLVTLLAAVLCYFMRPLARRRAGVLLLPLPNIFLNALLIPVILILVYGVPEGYPFLVLTVGIGEILASGVLGIPLGYFLARFSSHLFADPRP